MSSALRPATYTFVFFFSGSTSPSLRSSTCDSATALRATARCAADPIWSMFCRGVNGRSNRPISNFLVRIRLTASSILAVLTRPALTSSSSVASNCAKLAGCMNMSMPALTAVRTWSAKSPGS